MPTIEPIACRYDPGLVMAYYVDAPRPALIDAGGAVHPEGPIRAALLARGTDLDAIEVLVNTHGHWDHAGGDGAVRAAAPRVEIVVHEAGAPLLGDARAHLDGYATMAGRVLERPDLVVAQGAAFSAQFADGVTPDLLLVDGDRIDLGDGVVFEVLHVPGHADDQVALWWAEAGVLIAGDAAQGTGSRRGGGPLYFGGIAQARAGIGRLLEVPFDTLHVSHPFGRLGTEARPTSYDGEDGRVFLRDSLAALDLLRDALIAARDDRPVSPFPELARAATDRLIRMAPWPLQAEPATGVPSGVAPTLYRLWQELKEGDAA